MTTALSSWQFWALASAVFAALTAIFAKVGVLVALFGAVFLGERLSGTGWTGVALIALGAILVAIG